MKLVNIGSGNMVSAERIVSVVTPESAPIKRIIQDAKERGSESRIVRQLILRCIIS